jgi:hypothetical protein
VRSRPWLGIVLATVVVTVGFWSVALGSDGAIVLGLIVGGLCLVFAMALVAFISGQPDPAQSAYQSSLVALVIGGTLFVLWAGTESAAVGVALVVVPAGIGGAVALHPTQDRIRLAGRLAGIGVAFVIEAALLAADASVWALVAPLLPLPMMAAADVAARRLAEG